MELDKEKDVETEVESIRRSNLTAEGFGAIAVGAGFIMTFLGDAAIVKRGFYAFTVCALVMSLWNIARQLRLIYSKLCVIVAQRERE